MQNIDMQKSNGPSTVPCGIIHQNQRQQFTKQIMSRQSEVLFSF